MKRKVSLHLLALSTFCPGSGVSFFVFSSVMVFSLSYFVVITFWSSSIKVLMFFEFPVYGGQNGRRQRHPGF